MSVQQSRNIQWYPGHMTRTMRRIEKMLPQVNAVVQILDARIPASSLNPALQSLYGEKPRLYVLNKADLADEVATKQWVQAFKTDASLCVAANSKQRGAASQAAKTVNAALAELLERRKEKGMIGARTRIMVTGIPNAGKSTFINNWAGAARTKTGDKPGVTRGEQWVTAGEYELLDMPGVLWNKFETMETAVNMALIGSIPDYLLDVQEIAAGILQQLAGHYSARLNERFKLTPEELTESDGWVLLEKVGRRRGMLISGGEIDMERAASVVLDEFRGGKLGRITLEYPQTEEKDDNNNQ